MGRCEGSAVHDGWLYHEVPGVDAQVHRTGTVARVDQIVSRFDVTGLVGLDIGCGPGGITFELLNRGAKRMVGIDHDDEALRVARDVAANRASFLTGDIAELLPQLLDPPLRFDFAIWMSQYMWTVKQHGTEKAESLLAHLAKHVPTLIFETAAPGDGMAGKWGTADPGALLDRFYPNGTCLGKSPGGWGNRTVWLCDSSE